MKWVSVMAVFMISFVLLVGCAQSGVKDSTQQAQSGSSGQGDAMAGTEALNKVGQTAGGNGAMADGKGANDAMAGKAGAQDDATANDSGGTKTAAGEDGRMASASSYATFTKAAFDAAKSDGRAIFLEFYANWCPSCAQQKPVNEAAFADASMPPGISGFQVNYKDSDTDSDEEALAREFGISYQHTRVVLDSSGRQVYKATGNVGREELISLLADVRGA